MITLILVIKMFIVFNDDNDYVDYDEHDVNDCVRDVCDDDNGNDYCEYNVIML